MTFAVRPIGLVKTGFVWRPTISADVTNWVLYSQAIAAGWDGVAPLDAIVTVSSGIVLSANSTSAYGFDTGSGFPVGSVLRLIMPSYVCGMGGAGGNANGAGSGSAGSPGGPAIRAQFAIAIDATGGVIAGGGGGGGGGGTGLGAGYGGGGGGGRSGRNNSAPGVGGTTTTPQAGTFSIGGKGGSTSAIGGGAGGTTGDGANGPDFSGGSGGGGGGWGAKGGSGHVGLAGGAAGAAVVGNSYITWINTGTRYGAIT